MTLIYRSKDIPTMKLVGHVMGLPLWVEIPAGDSETLLYLRVVNYLKSLEGVPNHDTTTEKEAFEPAF